jgi:hypothetical protein
VSLDLRIMPTGNDWDAPVYVETHHPDGSPSHIAREVPEQLNPPCWVWPHAVVLVDGEMTAFDRNRQPAPEGA